ncbi:hypothetical protein BDV96DRAFT_655775 [Lophiotrema nucula]|uniref:Uncharacterized protein n=1 Tax=Lophiotrema nucula TaxID=690887 RepID=A0A6A5YDE1_9PLEO|nr:hypothetical protein BDV96DRAFT_655775 [Lophiotrema nucula]
MQNNTYHYAYPGPSGYEYVQVQYAMTQHPPPPQSQQFQHVHASAPSNPLQPYPQQPYPPQPSYPPQQTYNQQMHFQQPNQQQQYHNHPSQQPQYQQPSYPQQYGQAQFTQQQVPSHLPAPPPSQATSRGVLPHNAPMNGQTWPLNPPPQQPSAIFPANSVSSFAQQATSQHGYGSVQQPTWTPSQDQVPFNAVPQGPSSFPSLPPQGNHSQQIGHFQQHSQTSASATHSAVQFSNLSTQSNFSQSPMWNRGLGLAQQQSSLPSARHVAAAPSENPSSVAPSNALRLTPSIGEIEEMVRSLGLSECSSVPINTASVISTPTFPSAGQPSPTRETVTSPPPSSIPDTTATQTHYPGVDPLKFPNMKRIRENTRPLVIDAVSPDHWLPLLEQHPHYNAENLHGLVIGSAWQSAREKLRAYEQDETRYPAHLFAGQIRDYLVAGTSNPGFTKKVNRLENRRYEIMMFHAARGIRREDRDGEGG